MAVGALEPQFYAELLKGLNLDPNKVSQFDSIEENRKIFEDLFKTKTREEWCKVFDSLDACTFPVLDYHEAPYHQQNIARETFLDPSKTDGAIVPNPAPKLSRTPAKSKALVPERDSLDMAKEILNEIGIKNDEILKLFKENVLILDSNAKL